jgi:L,D-peptidoglycan transpeptidase YkuD (ErfK/YbiS/YcfS/YnhG family)
VRRIAAIAVAITALTVPAAAQTCPAPLRNAQRLVLVTARDMATSAANVELFERTSPAEGWRRAGQLGAARIGTAGMAWGYPYRALARAGEPVKREGDRRAPAGVYRIGRSFGFAASPRPGYLQLTAQTLCVDDVASPAYNRITSRARVGAGVHGEAMRASARYRRGLLVDYPTNAAARAGSCIFVHVWKSASSSTNGCVALSEDRVVTLQDFAASGAVIAILPRDGLRRMSACLPGVAASAR